MLPAAPTNQKSEDYLFHPLSSGQDLYWDEVYYQSGQWDSWDAGCQRLYSGYTYSNYYGSNWWINIGYWYTDETINDPSLGCSWWGEAPLDWGMRGQGLASTSRSRDGREACLG